MTPILQVCDLVINAVIKRKERTLRTERTYEAFQVFRKEYDKKSIAEKRLARFKPARPHVEAGVRDVLAMFDIGGDFRTKTFEEGQTRCFIKTGCIPKNDVAGASDFAVYYESAGTRKEGPLSLPMMAAEDIDTFVVNEEREEILDGINAFCDDSEEEDEEEEFTDDRN